jgi:Secretion system C-terminal sorting domain
MKKFLLFAILGCFWASASAQQHGHCGTTLADQLAYEDRLLANLAAPPVQERGNGVKYLPCFFHLVADANGEGRGTEQMIFNIMCTMNEEYLEHGIQFYLSPHPTLGWVDKTINHANVYSTQSNALAMNAKRHANAINIFIVDFAYSTSGDPGVLAYYSPARDWIVCEKTSTGLGDNTMPHEMGHFLSLQHTFFGWEQDAEDPNQPPCFEPGDPTWPNAPATSPGGVPTERQNGTNGTTAADKITDTPPDYNFGYCAPNTCPAYNGGARDPQGTLVDPMENNFMGYYFGCADFVFTPGQEAAMLADINSSSRNFLDNTFTPAAMTVESPTDLLIAPANAAVLATPSSAEVSWNAATGATHYLVQVDITPTYLSPQTQTVWLDAPATSYTFTGLQPNKTHYWRVRPINAYYQCATPRQRNFKTAVSSTQDIEEVGRWSIQPNPAGDEPTIVMIQAIGTLEASVRVFDATGRTVWAQEGQTFFSGENRIELPVATLTNGIYFVALESAKGSEIKRLVVAK